MNSGFGGERRKRQSPLPQWAPTCSEQKVIEHRSDVTPERRMGAAAQLKAAGAPRSDGAPPLKPGRLIVIRFILVV